MPFRPLTATTTQAGPTPGFRPLSAAPAPTPVPTAAPSLREELQGAQKERAGKILEANEAYAKGDQGAARTLFHVGGQLVGGAVDPIAKTAARYTPEFVKKGLGAIFKPATERIAKSADILSDLPAVQRLADSPAGDSLERDVEAIQEYTALLPVPKATKIGAKALPKAADTAVKDATAAGMRAGQAFQATPRKLGSIASGVPEDVISRASDPNYAPLIERAMNHIAENEKQPFHELANRATTRLNEAQSNAANKLANAKDLFRDEFPKASFDVSPKIPKIVEALKPFRSSGLSVEETSYRISRTLQSPFSAREVSALNMLMNKMRASDDVGIDDLLALRQSFNAAYDEIPLGHNQTPRPYHAVVMALKKSAEPAIDEILPPELRDAFREYAELEDMKSAIGNKLVDGSGEVKQTAEQFLANLSNMNKGEQRIAAERFREITGLDLNVEAQAVKDAQKLSHFFPATGSRTQDIMRSLLASGLGTATLGPLGTAVGVAVTSPKLIGKAALTVGKARLKRQSRPLSPKADATAITRTKATNTSIRNTILRRNSKSPWPKEPPF